MKRILCISLMSMLSMAVFALGSYSYDLSLPRIDTKGDYTSIQMDGTQLWGESGDPALPWFGTMILLPLGDEATEISVIRSNPKTYIISRVIEPIPHHLPFSISEIPEPVQPNSGVYLHNDVFPRVPHNGVNTHFLGGHSINFTAICPFDYNPVSGELTFYQHLQVSVKSSPTDRATEALALLKQDAHTASLLTRSVDNQNAVPRYETRTSGIEYIIVYDSAKHTQWLPLRDFYAQRGLNVMMKPIQEIVGEYTGQDTQAKLRNFITTMYSTNSLRHVLLAGDTDIIPHRGFYVNFTQGGQTDADIPADMYYSCLDGNWNNDGDNYWGEMYESDLAPEISLGRYCYNSDAEIASFINKVMMYHVAPVEVEAKTATFVGEWLWDGPTWGGDYMDEMIGGSSMFGYTTVGVPTSWNISTLYDRTYGYEEAWGVAQIRPLLSQGANLVNHLGHSNTTYNMRLSNNQVTSSTITNDGSNHNFSIYFTQGCYAGAFDNRTTNVGQYTSDCITEKFTSITTSAVSMISHSRYGWGMQGSTNGASQYLHRQYIDAIFGENIYELGYTLTDCKIDNIPYIQNSPVMYWVTYETNLIGDPGLTIWADTPQQIIAQMPSLWNVGTTNYQILTNAPNANFRMKVGSTFVCETTADATGLINIHLLQTLAPGEYEVYITAPNFYAYSSVVNVQATQMPYIVATNLSHNDADALLHTGEVVTLNFNLKNVGSVDQSGPGSVTLSSTSPNINILSGVATFNAIAAADSIYMDGAFSVRIVGNYADAYFAPLTFTTAFDGYSATSTAILRLNSPNVSLISYQVQNPTPIVNPGQNPGIRLNLTNTGSGNAYNPMLILFSESPFVTLSDYEVMLPPIPAGQQSTVSNSFTINISENAPMNSDISIGYILGAENGPSIEGSFLIHLGMLNYSFEQDTMGWTNAALSASFVNQWHHSSARNYTTGGSYSMKFGGTGSTAYANSAYGALISPEFTLGLNSQLKFYHWMDAEIHTTPTYAWDGGMVQMSINGGAWTQITPVGGYPCRIYTNTASPFAANTNVWSGSIPWTEVTFDLATYSGTARFRFIFGSDGYVNGEGWYIDDVRLESEFVSNDDNAISPATYKLFENYPNPFNPSTTIGFSIPATQRVDLAIYNLKGQRVRTLLSSDMSRGSHSVVWNGLDDQGRPVSSGVYLYRLNSGSYSQSRKMMLMK